MRGSDLALILATLESSHLIPSRTMSVKRIAGWSSASLLVLMMLVSATPRLSAQDVTLNEELLDNYAWRNLGPDRGGRSIGVTGVIGQPDVAYFGAVGGGLWKTSNGGQDWNSITDFKINSSSVGAVEVSETNEPIGSESNDGHPCHGHDESEELPATLAEILSDHFNLLSIFIVGE